MTLLILGLLLWSGVHLFKRVAPDARAKMGDKAKGMVALGSLAAIVLMVVGYRSWHSDLAWYPPAGMMHATHLLMVFAMYLFVASSLKTRITRVLRHPQLTAVKVWALAHLLVNGDWASVVLFGGIMAWAVAEVIVINRAQARATPPERAPLGKEVAAIVVAIGLAVAIGYAHTIFGLFPFGA